ncbi:MAG: riboflavin synthase, alpha subunit [Bryobacterales bacterium]|nr:riboflavin synthase, alpha subunit [Bryobacterales bacterium]
MFTGIVEETGIATEVGTRLTISCRVVLSDLVEGGSISVSGVCLTAVEIRSNSFSADLAPETLERSNLGDLRIGSVVNLERPLTLAQRLSGHIVQGHVDGTGVVLSTENFWLKVKVPRELVRYLVYKGSISLDGISLTIAALDDDVVSAAIIPHTWEHTSLSTRKPGDRINIECDVLAKHVEQLLKYR